MEDDQRTREISLALADLYAPGLNAGTYVDRVFQLTSRLVPLVLSSHGVIDRATGRLDAHFDHHPTGLENAFNAFGALMHKYEPTRFDPSTNSGRPFSLRDFFSKPSLEDLDIYQEVYRPMSYRDHCFVHVRTNMRETVFVGFFRDDGCFQPPEKTLLELLQPHMANARQLALTATAVSDVEITPGLFATAGFTPRECEVIYWLTQGKSNDEIASILRIRSDSVSRNLQAIYIKMGVEHRIAAIIHALTLSRRLHAEQLAASGETVHLSVTTKRHVRQ